MAKRAFLNAHNGLDAFVSRALSAYDGKNPVKVLVMRSCLEVMGKMIKKDPKMAETYIERGFISMLTPILIEGDFACKEVVRGACGLLSEITDIQDEVTLVSALDF
jgi:hypothetical protein